MPKPPKLSNFRLSQAAAEDQIHDRARHTANIGLTMHAKERMQERDINSTDLYRILRLGIVEQDPEPTRNGEWTCKITHRLRGRRTAGVVLVIRKKADALVIVTVEWEDKR